MLLSAYFKGKGQISQDYSQLRYCVCRSVYYYQSFFTVNRGNNAQMFISFDYFRQHINVFRGDSALNISLNLPSPSSAVCCKVQSPAATELKPSAADGVPGQFHLAPGHTDVPN